MESILGNNEQKNIACKATRGVTLKYTSLGTKTKVYIV